MSGRNGLPLIMGMTRGEIQQSKYQMYRSNHSESHKAQECLTVRWSEGTSTEGMHLQICVTQSLCSGDGWNCWSVTKYKRCYLAEWQFHWFSIRTCTWNRSSLKKYINATINFMVKIQGTQQGRGLKSSKHVILVMDERRSCKRHSSPLAGEAQVISCFHCSLLQRINSR